MNRFSRRNTSLRSLIRTFSWLTTAVVVFVVGIASVVRVQNALSSSQQARTIAVSEMSNQLAQHQQDTDQFAAQINERASNLANLVQYFSQSPADYAEYAIDDSLRGNQYWYWPREAQNVMIQKDQITRVVLTMAASKKVFVATRDDKMGHLYNKYTLTNALVAASPLTNPYTSIGVGTLRMTYDPSAVTGQLRRLHDTAAMQLLVFDNDGKQLWHYQGAAVKAASTQAVQKTVAGTSSDDLARALAPGYFVQVSNVSTGGYRVFAVVARAAVYAQIGQNIALYALLGALVLAILLTLLRLIFRRYQHALTVMVGEMQVVGAGHLQDRVTIPARNEDLQILAKGINWMLDDINGYIYEIYQLKIDQQDAHMKALQAQINPHFLYNTLEYIRMAALDADQTELAEVVFSFASLMRNNTDQSPVTTLGDELGFIEKYVYLYQMRYPDRLAYQIQLAPAVAGLHIPKFTLQPIVENYFAHGVDFHRRDNVIEVKAHPVGDQQVIIQVLNNGRSLSPERVAQVNATITAQPLEQPQSIGLQNVFARLQHFFGPSATMRLANRPGGGVMTTILLPGQKGVEQRDESRDHR